MASVLRENAIRSEGEYFRGEHSEFAVALSRRDATRMPAPNMRASANLVNFRGHNLILAVLVLSDVALFQGSLGAAFMKNGNDQGRLFTAGNQNGIQIRIECIPTEHPPPFSQMSEISPGILSDKLTPRQSQIDVMQLHLATRKQGIWLPESKAALKTQKLADGP